MSQSHNPNDFFVKMLKDILSEQQARDQSKWLSRVYVNELDALGFATRVTSLTPGQILGFQYKGKHLYGVFYGFENVAALVYRFDKEEHSIVRTQISPDNILNILSFAELAKRLSAEDHSD